VSGWAFDDVMVSKVEIMIDGVVDGAADYGQPRPDVAQAYPNFSPVNVGFTYSFTTIKFSNGPHVLTIRSTDTSNNFALSPGVMVTVATRTVVAASLRHRIVQRESLAALFPGSIWGFSPIEQPN